MNGWRENMTKGVNRKGFVGGLGGLLAMCAVATECRAETALEDVRIDAARQGMVR